MQSKLKKKTFKIQNSVFKSEKPTNDKKLYFGKDTHEAIVKYQSTDDRDEKSKLYEEIIRPSFHKLVENLIYIHNFSTDQTHFQIIKTDCVTFLYETLEKFDKEKGSKAFSYFNVCAKNFLIIQSNKRNKNRNRHVSLDDFVHLSSKDKAAIENHGIINSPDSEIIFNEDKVHLFEMFDLIKNKTKNEQEKKCMHAIIHLFKSVDELEFLNKRAIFIYLREISGLNPKQLSVSMSNIRKYWKDVSKNNEDFQFLFSTRR